MAINKYAEKIRRRKQLLKEVTAEYGQTLTKKQNSWLWVLAMCLLIYSLIFLILVCQDQSFEGWSPVSVMFLVSISATSLLLLVLWLMPKLYVRSLRYRSLGVNQSEFDREKEKLKLEDDTRKTLAQIIGGAVFLFGLLFTYNTYQLSIEKQNLDRESQITDRFTKAVSQLGSEDISVRLGGLYALERIAKDSPKDHWTVMEILSAYIREKLSSRKLTLIIASGRKQNNATEANQTENNSLKTDVQTALTIIGRRKIEQDPPSRRIDLSNVNLSGANLNGGNLSNANLSGSNLNGATLSFVTLNFANLSKAQLTNAELDNASLKAANLSDANLRGTDLSNANLDTANLQDSDLSFVNFTNANLNYAELSNANLNGTFFKGADLRGSVAGDFYSSNAKGLKYEQVKNAFIDVNTKLPAYLDSDRQKLLDSAEENKLK